MQGLIYSHRSSMSYVHHIQCHLPMQGVMYSHRSNYLHALLVAFKDVIGLGSSSCFYAIVPMFHANSWGLVFAAPMTGARLVLPGKQQHPCIVKLFPCSVVNCMCWSF